MNLHQSVTSSRNNRRRFLAQAAAAAALVTAKPFAGVHSAFGATGSDSGVLRLASIGVGGMGASDLASLSSHAQVQVVALCDVDARNLASAKQAHPNAAVFKDYREMLKVMHDGIDAVNISTPDHTHAAATLSAMKQGKHVYTQKPLTHDVYEARQLRLEAEKTKVVTQMGTQIHSHTNYRTAVELVQSGVIGKVKEAHSWSSKSWGYDGPAPETSAVPEYLDWDLWLGTAPFRPYSEGHYHPANWRKWYDFGCGTMGDMAIHILDPVFTALQLGAPTRIESTSPVPPKDSYGLNNQTRFDFAASSPFTTDGFVLTWSDGGLMPNTSDWPKRFDGDKKEIGLPDQGSMFVGEKGYILLPHVAPPILLPESDFAKTEIQSAPHGDHYHLFVDACLGGKPTTAGFDYAGPLTETVLLGVLANRFPNRPMTWDAPDMILKGNDDAAELLRRAYRDGFGV